MNSFTILDIVIGLVFIYLLYSLLGTIVQEFIATLFSFRSKVLERALCRMLEDGKLFDRRFSSMHALFKKNSPCPKDDKLIGQFYEHPNIKYLSEGKRNDKPSYIDKEYFSRVLIDLLHGENVEQNADVKELIDKTLKEGVLPGTSVKIGAETLRQLRSLWFEAHGSTSEYRILLEQWFDATMDRCTGWYKSKTQYILLAIGLAMAIVFNIDTIAIVGKLQKDTALRESMVQQADRFLKEHPKLFDKGYQQIVHRDSIRLQQSDSALIAREQTLTHVADSLLKSDIGKSTGLLGLGWDKISFGDIKKTTQVAWYSGFGGFLVFLAMSLGYLILKLIGWGITALAISLGAPFWFDLLNKLMKLRTSIKIPGTSDSKEKKG